MVSSKVIALILRDARMASLSARVGSSLLGTLADRIQHMSHKFTLTARRSALLNGEPCKNTDVIILQIHSYNFNIEKFSKERIIIYKVFEYLNEKYYFKLFITLNKCNNFTNYKYKIHLHYSLIHKHNFIFQSRIRF